MESTGKNDVRLADQPERAMICYSIFRFLNSMSDSRFGFSSFAEQWNGRLAMLGFVIGLGTELLTGQGILSQVGLG